jgi:hypothetical protein
MTINFSRYAFWIASYGPSNLFKPSLTRVSHNHKSEFGSSLWPFLPTRSISPTPQTLTGSTLIRGCASNDEIGTDGARLGRV